MKSAIAIRLAKVAPNVARSVLRTIARIAPESESHWLMQQLVSDLNCYVPVKTILGNGMPMYVVWKDNVSGAIRRNGFFEPEVVGVLRRRLRPGARFVDVGAHLGQYTLLGSGLVGAHGRVFAFEPNPAANRILQMNISRNGLKNVTLFREAVGNCDHVIRLYESAIENIGNTGCVQPTKASGRVMSVRCRKLDNCNLAPVDLIKIDVEGMELEVLEGAVALLRAQPDIVLEFAEETQKRFGRCCADVAEFLRDHGYDLQLITTDGLVPYRMPRSEEYLNVLARPVAFQHSASADHDCVFVLPRRQETSVRF